MGRSAKIQTDLKVLSGTLSAGNWEFGVGVFIKPPPPKKLAFTPVI